MMKLCMSRWARVNHCHQEGRRCIGEAVCIELLRQLGTTRICSSSRHLQCLQLLASLERGEGPSGCCFDLVKLVKLPCERECQAICVFVPKHVAIGHLVLLVEHP